MPHEEMSCIKREYLRRLNTLRLSINSADGFTKNDLGEFNFVIPPFPSPTHGGSQYALFKLISYYVLSQDETDRVVNAVGQDVSGFYVEVNGLGITPNLQTTHANQRLRGTNTFAIVNVNGQAELGQGADGGNQQFNVVSGGFYHGNSVVCSNPAGTEVNIKVFSLDDGTAIADNVALTSVLDFEIEILDLS
tara:strand:- start:349 stop:924 length:576 start_codon:yes stop_codon:yes gene_type:complete